MRWKPEGENGEYRCCLCCHVRTGTIFFGMFSLVMQILMLSMFAVIVLHPSLIKQEEGALQAQLLATTTPPPAPLEQERKTELELEQEFFGDADSTSDKHKHFRTFGNSTEEDKFVCMLLVMACFFATIMLVYGSIKGIPGYLMPFFCIQVFSFCISCLTILSYFSSAPDIKKFITAQKDIPYKEELLAMDNDLLTLLAVVSSVILLSIKAYFIGMVWSCYKYLTVLSRGQLNVNNRAYAMHAGGEDGEMLLPPKYEDAIRMEVPEETYPDVPPPPYSSNVAINN